MRIRAALLFALFSLPAFAQPGQPAPVQPSLTMQNSNLKPALPGELLGVGIDQKLDQQVPLDLVFRDEAGRTVYNEWSRCCIFFSINIRVSTIIH